MIEMAIVPRLFMSLKNINDRIPKTLTLLIVVSLLAWSFLFYQHGKMSQMPMSKGLTWQWQTSDFIVVYIMWAVMMAAMMLPSAMPMIYVFGKTCQKKYGNDLPFSMLFSSAYLLVWLVFSIALTLLQWQFHNLQWLSSRMESSHTLVSAAIFITAGVYQFTAIKNACLNYRRSPLSFLLNFWQNGRWGAFKMGIVHGGTCVGCCWAQMLIMFAVGVMNITAMIIITLYVILEKNSPKNSVLLSKSVGVFLCLWGVFSF